MEMQTKSKPYLLEKIPYGDARVNVLRTKQGVYSLHGQTGWDDTPYWEWKDAWILTVQAYGLIDWGPFKHRKNARRLHIGTSRINLIEAGIFYYENEAKEKSANTLSALESKRFQCTMNFGEEEEPRILGVQYRLDVPLSNFILRQLNPKLEDLYL